MATVAPPLAPYVASVVAYDVEMGAPGVHRGLPSTTLTFVLPLGEPVEVGWRGQPQSRAKRWSTVSGLHAHPAEIHHDGHQAGVQLALTPVGARALLGVPAAELSGELLELSEVAPDLRDLPERLAECATAGRVRVVETALMSALARHGAPEPRGEVGHALGRLTRGAGVQAVAAEVGYSRRHLANLVRAACGMTPKDLQRLGRFEASRSRIGRIPLADVASSCGYADQAHLTREWVTLAGCPPTTWLHEEFPFLQDIGGYDAAG